MCVCVCVFCVWVVGRESLERAKREREHIFAEVMAWLLGSYRVRVRRYLDIYNFDGPRPTVGTIDPSQEVVQSRLVQERWVGSGRLTTSWADGLMMQTKSEATPKFHQVLLRVRGSWACCRHLPDQVKQMRR